MVPERDNWDITVHCAYYRVVCILTELLGKDVMTQAYLAGNENLIYSMINHYAGVTNSATLINTNVKKMTTALVGGVYTWMDELSFLFTLLGCKASTF